MQDGITLDRLAELRGTAVYSSEGEKIGRVEEIFMDEETQRPEWIGIGTGFFGTKRVLVPVEGASLGSDQITVPYTTAQVKDSPDIDSDEITQSTEAQLYSHYGLGYSESRSQTGLPKQASAPADAQPQTERGEREIVRSEEEVAVGTRPVEAGRVRVRKWVETEPVEMDVELRRETARVRREPIDEPISDAEFGADELEVPLRAEEPVVEKQAVAKERVSLETDVAVDTQTVSDEVRKERVDVEGDDVTSDR